MKKITFLQLIFLKIFFLLRKVIIVLIILMDYILIYKKIFDNLNLKRSTLLFFPYEGQPFQKKIICYLKQNSKSLKIIGYDHTPPQNLPVNLFYTKNSPDKLYVTGSSQKEFYSKNLCGQKKDLSHSYTKIFKNKQKRFYK